MLAKKLLARLVSPMLVAGLCNLSFATSTYTVRMADNHRGQAVSAYDAGCEVTNVRNSTTETLVLATPGLIYWVFLTSGTTAAQYVVLRDTGSTTNSGAAALEIMTISPNIPAYGTAGMVSSNTYVKFDPPLQVNFGATVDPADAVLRNVAVCAKSFDGTDD